MKLKDVKAIVKAYAKFDIGYDTAIEQLMKLGLTEGQADNMLFSFPEAWRAAK